MKLLKNWEVGRSRHFALPQGHLVALTSLTWASISNLCPWDQDQLSLGLLVAAWAVLRFVSTFFMALSGHRCCLSGPWHMDWLPGLTSDLPGNHRTVSGTGYHHWDWPCPADQLLGWALVLLCHHELAWWSGLSAEPNYHPWACPAPTLCSHVVGHCGTSPGWWAHALPALLSPLSSGSLSLRSSWPLLSPLTEGSFPNKICWPCPPPKSRSSLQVQPFLLWSSTANLPSPRSVSKPSRSPANSACCDGTISPG